MTFALDLETKYNKAFEAGYNKSRDSLLSYFHQIKSNSALYIAVNVLPLGEIQQLLIQIAPLLKDIDENVRIAAAYILGQQKV